jgi:hypothetical protein
MKDRARKWIQLSLDSLAKAGFEKFQFEAAIDKIGFISMLIKSTFGKSGWFQKRRKECLVSEAIDSEAKPPACYFLDCGSGFEKEEWELWRKDWV